MLVRELQVEGAAFISSVFTALASVQEDLRSLESQLAHAEERAAQARREALDGLGAFMEAHPALTANECLHVWAEGGSDE